LGLPDDKLETKTELCCFGTLGLTRPSGRLPKQSGRERKCDVTKNDRKNMEVNPKVVRERVETLRKEIAALVSADKENRVRGSFVAWEDRKQHDIRLARIQEIKTELEKLTRGRK
jgi:hypothetical protein